jgi:hypothetical protein
MKSSTASIPLLKIRAHDPQEMDVLSALVQDAILHKTAFYYDPKAERVHLLVNRFCWEHAVHKDTAPSNEPYYRVHAGLYFHHVTHVWTNALFRRHPSDKLLVLLVVYMDNKSDIHLVFSEGAHIRLSTQRCCAYLKDLHDHWPTPSKPVHA